MPPFTIIKGIKKLKILSVLDFAAETIVDYGCGSGSALLIAAESGFGNVIGIGLSPSLARLCRANIVAYSRMNQKSVLKVNNVNAIEYLPWANATVFFSSSRSWSVSVEKYMNRIRTSVAEHPRSTPGGGMSGAGRVSRVTPSPNSR